MKAVAEYQPQSVVLGGGVSANERLRSRLSEEVQKVSLEFYAAPIEFTGDNAAMIAAAGYFRARVNQFDDARTMVAEPNLKL